MEYAATLDALKVEALPWDNPQALASCSHVIKHSATRSVVRINNPACQTGPHLYVKRYHFREFRRGIKSALGLSRARNEWRACRALRARGVGAPRPVLVADRRIGLLDYESYLVTEAVEASSDVAQLIAQTRGPSTDQAMLRLGRLVGNLHHRGIYHDDLKSCHILLANGRLPDNGLDGVILIDLYRCRIGRRPSLRRRGVNLAQLLISLPVSAEHQTAALIHGFIEVLPTSRPGRLLLERSVASALAVRKKRRALHDQS